MVVHVTKFLFKNIWATSCTPLIIITFLKTLCDKNNWDRCTSPTCSLSNVVPLPEDLTVPIETRIREQETYGLCVPLYLLKLVIIPFSKTSDHWGKRIMWIVPKMNLLVHRFHVLKVIINRGYYAVCVYLVSQSQKKMSCKVLHTINFYYPGVINIYSLVLILLKNLLEFWLNFFVFFSSLSLVQYAYKIYQ